MNTKILVIDDEESVCEILKYNLEKEGYEVDVAYSAEQAINLNLAHFDLFIVDIMMGELSGFDFAKRLRIFKSTEHTPVIFCSALTQEDEKVMGLNMGADDYVTKPFTIGEMLARVRAVLRRTDITRAAKHEALRADSDYQPDLVFKTLRLNRNEKLCYLDNQSLQLTPTEFELLEFFLSHPNRIHSRREIINQVWGDDIVVTNRTIDTNITRMRKKLGQYSQNIITRQGFGYGFKETN
jgi:two-component system phosphate regulon response regulator PhoB